VTVQRLAGVRLALVRSAKALATGTACAAEGSPQDRGQILLVKRQAAGHPIPIPVDLDPAMPSQQRELPPVTGHFKPNTPLPNLASLA
jgi:hypothetical protein